MGERILIGLLGLATIAGFAGSIVGIVLSSKGNVSNLPAVESRINDLKDELPKKSSLSSYIN